MPTTLHKPLSERLQALANIYRTDAETLHNGGSALDIHDLTERVAYLRGKADAYGGAAVLAEADRIDPSTA
ncbi:MAG: hypothetical protein ACRDU4_01170 [Mycobacterium sp.]